MEHRFDTLAKSLAGSISRREALSRVGGGIAGLLLTTLGLGTAWSDPATSSQCEDFCRACPGISPGGGNAFGKCVSSCEACVNGSGNLPCACPTAAGGAVVCCTAGLTCCSGQCTDTSSDRNNCGACAGAGGSVCSNVTSCVNGACCVGDGDGGCDSGTPCCFGEACIGGVCGGP